MDNILRVDIIDNQQLRPSDRYGYVYLITNLINNKKYLGVKEKSVFDENYFGSGIAIKRAVSKYGKENFKIEILEWCANKEQLYDEEYRLSILWDIVNDSNWYNCMEGGHGGNTKVNYTEEQKAEFSKKISNSKRNRPRSEKELQSLTKMHDAWSGSHHTSESKEKIRQANLGHEVTESMRKKMSENHADVSGKNNPFYGDHRFAGKNNPMYGKSAIKGKIWITNKIDTELLINKSELNNYPDFVKGRLRKSQKKVKSND
jgi:hypothetical protein